ncbi:MAG: hypothetical protein ABH827_03970 [bacterium]
MARNINSRFYSTRILLFLFLFFSTINAKITFQNKNSDWVICENNTLYLNTANTYGWQASSITKNNGYTGAANTWTGYPAAPWTATNIPSLDVINNSNAINYNTPIIRTNSNAINYYAPIIRNNSYLLNQTSNALVKNTLNIRTNSNALVKNTLDIRTNSNAILYGDRTNSNAINYYTPIIRNNSYLLNQTSNALVKNTIDTRTNSNALVKNTLDIRTNSNALVKNTLDIRTNSNALTYNTDNIKNNSNTIVATNRLTKQNSSAIIKNTADISAIPSNTVVVGTSNAMVYYAPMIRNNSYLLNQTSNALVKNTLNIRTNSNAILYGDKTNSNAINYYAPIIRNNSYLLKQTSNSIANPLIKTSNHLSTGALILTSDLLLTANCTVDPTSCNIYGNGHTIYLGGDLVLPDDYIMLIGSDTIIDGNGHSLILGKRSEIAPEYTLTLTLRNLTLKNILNPLPDATPIYFDASNCNLALDNVTMALTDDFPFDNYNNGAKLFIHNDVIFTGTSKFIYQSDKPAYIDGKSTFYFDNNTTFSFAPLSTNKDLIYMKDKTSTLYLNNATLAITHTGLRLTKGNLLLENNVTFTSQRYEGSHKQALSNSFVFGNATLGENYDLNVQILNNAKLNVKGMIKNNNIN